MNLLKDLQQNTLHHAYALSGSGEEFLESLFKLFKEGGIATEGNPDFIWRKFENLGVDEARSLKEEAALKGFGTTKKIFIIEADSLTREAQNALLKLFEEPIAHTHFFLVVRETKHLLPTLLSRVIILETEKKKEDFSEAKKFLSMSYKYRLEFIKKRTDKKGKEDIMNKSEALTLLNGIEVLLYKLPPLNSHLQTLLELAKSRSYITDQGASLKMILEHIALVLPQL